jgi:G3E family GTPase
MPAIPITVFTGFLGAGKTVSSMVLSHFTLFTQALSVLGLGTQSIILSLLPQLPKDYKVVLLKNEFGDIEGAWLLFFFFFG